MKLLFTQDALVNAGAERSHLEILSRFSKDVDVGLVYFYPKHDLKPKYKRAGIRLFFLDIPERYHFVLAVWRLVKLIRKEKPDLLVSSLWRADIITRIASLITRVPLVGTLVNDSYSPIAWTDKKGLKYKIVYWLDRWTAGIPVHWIANAQALADSHVRTLGLKRGKISVVYRGRSVPVIASDAEAKQSLPKNQFSNSEIAFGGGDLKHKSNKMESNLAVTRHFISYGRLLERKGFQDAIKAFSKVLKTYPDCTLTIFGEGPYRIHLEKLIKELDLNNSVFLPGKIANPMELLLSGYHLQSPYALGSVQKEPMTSNSQTTTYNLQLTNTHLPITKAHCFLFPSWYEGFSGALVEAMMAGIPIIASDIPMNLEAVADQKSALVFPVQNIETLKDNMLWAIENPVQMETFGKEARRTAVDRFDIENIAFSYEEVLKGLSRKLSTQ